MEQLSFAHHNSRGQTLWFFAVLKAWLMSPLRCVLNLEVFLHWLLLMAVVAHCRWPTVWWVCKMRLMRNFAVRLMFATLHTLCSCIHVVALYSTLHSVAGTRTESLAVRVGLLQSLMRRCLLVKPDWVHWRSSNAINARFGVPSNSPTTRWNIAHIQGIVLWLSREVFSPRTGSDK